MKKNILSKVKSGRGTKGILIHSTMDQLEKIHDIISVPLTPSM